MRSIAVVGAGYWGKDLIRNFAGLGALHTICDNNPKVLKQFEMTYPDVRREISLQSVPASNEVKGVVISTPG